MRQLAEKRDANKIMRVVVADHWGLLVRPQVKRQYNVREFMIAIAVIGASTAVNGSDCM